MAQVDFSNAVLDVFSGNPMTFGNYMQLYYVSSNSLDDPNGNPISTPVVSKILDTPTKVSILYAGSIVTSNVSGTEFLLRIGNTRVWKVSNISFATGDTYSFVIDIEVSGNT